MKEEFVSIKPINLNQFEKLTKNWNIKSLENAGVMADLGIAVDDTILYVKKSRVNLYLEDKENLLVRIGFKQFPKIEIKCEEDFWKFMALLVEIEECPDGSDDDE